MAGVCSKHRSYDKNCAMCNGTPWDLLGVSQQEYEAKVRYAESEGIINCLLCEFAMYRRTCRQDDGRYLCPRCGKYFREN